MHWIVRALLAVLSSTCALSALAAPERPVVVIPGILGSKLCEKGSGRVVWGNRSSLRNFAELELPPFAEPAALRHESCGIIEQIEILGPWRVHQYDDLLATLTNPKLGYVKGMNLFIFDYDWRLSNQVSAERLSERIRAWVGESEIDLIAHSMGGIVARLYLDQHGGAARVKRLITLGTPYRGSANAIRTLDQGWGFWANLAARGLDRIRTTAMSFPSIYELLPNYKLGDCCGWRTAAGKVEYFDPLDPAVWARLEFLPRSYREAPRKDWLADTLARTREIHSLMAADFPAGIRRFTVATGLISTPWRVTFDYATGKVVAYSYRQGDGTVMDYSAADWELDQARPSTTEHQRIFADDAVRQVIAWVLAGDREPVAGVLSGFAAQLETADRRKLEVTAVAFSVDPPVLGPGEAGTLWIDLTGAAALANADLSSVWAELDTGDVALAVEQRSGGGRDATVSLAFPFTAPWEAGVHSLSVILPGVAQLQEYVLVVAE